MINLAGPESRSLEPRRLWSLWDMQKFHAVSFYQVSAYLRDWRNFAEQVNDAISTIQPNTKFLIQSHARALATHLEILGAPVTIKALATLAALLENEKADWKEIRHWMRSIDERLEDELGAKFLLALPPGKESLYEQSVPLFGIDVATKFPSLSYEIDEAGKCLALGRSTASAFHAIRCLEGGIAAISRYFKIPDPIKGSDRSWKKLLDKISDAIKERWNSSQIYRSAEHRKFDEAHASLAAMQNPWRNSTMHLDQKYTEDEAMRILIAISGFMQTISTMIDENGVPVSSDDQMRGLEPYLLDQPQQL